MNKIHGIKAVSYFAFIAMAIAFIGCKSDLKTPEEVAEKYAIALLNRDYGAMKSLSTKKKKELLTEDEKAQKERLKKLTSAQKEMYDKVISEMKTMTPKRKPTLMNENGDKARIKFSLDNINSFIETFILDGDIILKVSLIKEKDVWKIDKANGWGQYEKNDVLFENIKPDVINLTP